MNVFKPVEVTEPVTGLTWIARTRGQYWLAWWPTALLALMFMLGVGVGYFAAH